MGTIGPRRSSSFIGTPRVDPRKASFDAAGVDCPTSLDSAQPALADQRRSSFRHSVRASIHRDQIAGTAVGILSHLCTPAYLAAHAD